MELEEILKSLKNGKLSTAQAKKLLSLYSIDKIGDFAKIDTGRKNRRGIPEVIFAENKQLDDIKKIIQQTLKRTNSVLVSRIKKMIMTRLLLLVKKSKSVWIGGKIPHPFYFIKNQSKYHMVW